MSAQQDKTGVTFSASRLPSGEGEQICSVVAHERPALARSMSELKRVSKAAQAGVFHHCIDIERLLAKPPRHANRNHLVEA